MVQNRYNDRVILNQDTAANWTARNPVLWNGEPGLEYDTLKCKIGDGVTAWNSLSYFVPSGSSGTDLSNPFSAYAYKNTTAAGTTPTTWNSTTAPGTDITVLNTGTGVSYASGVFTLGTGLYLVDMKGWVDSAAVVGTGNAHRISMSFSTVTSGYGTDGKIGFTYPIPASGTAVSEWTARDCGIISVPTSTDYKLGADIELNNTAALTISIYLTIFKLGSTNIGW